MPRVAHRLSALRVKSDLPPGLYGDGHGLYLQVSAQKTKAWVYRYMIAGRARKMGLGPIHSVSLSEARKRASDMHRQIWEGVDPIEARHKKKIEQAVALSEGITFRECAKKYIDAHASSWKSARHKQQWKVTLDQYVNPVVGDMPVSAVEKPHVLAVLEPIWLTKTETARRVRGRIETVLDWAKARDYRGGENPARWRGHLEQLLPARARIAPVKNLAAMPYRDLPRFMTDLREQVGVNARALEFLILTAARTGDVIGATWNEIDAVERLWIVPGARIKSRKGSLRRDHVVPLCDRAIELLNGLQRDADFIFIGTDPGKPISPAVMIRLTKELVGEEVTVHGFRSAFRDWGAEQTNYPNEMLEMALAHTVSDKTEAAYRRGDMREKRRALMNDWAAYCAGGQHVGS
ncbi:site-specific integrase [Bradyrhizobium sp. JYMT SZCCT0428]|uniref:tyrosine-type recombinase/integrase n=1 Tax=Bradyrhizobium sp. JYMT SZCCT0428 TaxID=2807673 RepID=UPI001BA9FF4F|nr:site-specific integrase [Bradyrhizobium sp. JYMT SZCCT0428]MBR1149352.1 integrase arm-type DNA-binding domain-containing protein [Bradyrhizobium sp. JYMT SZCCT0428]